METRRQTSIKVDPIAWNAAKIIFREYNLTVTDAINIFLNRVRIEGGLPFSSKSSVRKIERSYGRGGK